VDLTEAGAKLACRSRRRDPPHHGSISVAVEVPWTTVWTAVAAMTHNVREEEEVVVIMGPTLL
jgi:hypothetical protein